MALHLPRVLPVPAPPAVVWDLLVDTERWADWGPSVRAARVDDDRTTRVGPDATGAVLTPVGAWIPFTITSWEETPSRSAWAWRVAGIAATDHWVEVDPDDAAACTVGMSVPIWAPAYLTVVELALRNIRRLASRDA